MEPLAASPASPQTRPKPPPARRSRSMAWKILLAMFAVVLVALLLTAVVVERFVSANLVSDQQELMVTRAEQMAGQLGAFRDEQLRSLRRVAVDPQLPDASNPIRARTFLESALADAGELSGLALITNQGTVVAATADALRTADFTAMAWFTDSVGGNTGLSHLQLIQPAGSPAQPAPPVFFAYTPAGVAGSEVKQILIGVLPAPAVWAITDPLQFSESGYAYLSDDNTVLIAHGARSAAGRSTAAMDEPTHALIFDAIGSLEDPLIVAANAAGVYRQKVITATAGADELAAFIQALPPDTSTPQLFQYYFPAQNADKTSVVVPVGPAGYLGAPVSIGPKDWVVGITVTDADILKPLNDLRRALIVVVGLSLLLSALVGWLAALSISRPARQLAALARRVEAGDTSARSPLRSGDEIGQLAAALNAMLDQLGASLAVQQNQIHTLHSAGEQVSQGAVSLSASAEEMASAAEELNTSAEQVVQAVQTLAHDAGVQMNHVQQTAGQIHGLDQEIGRIAALSSDLDRAAGEMRNAAGEAEEAIRETTQLTRRVGAVLHLIEKFGRQTNMLALNATIEAARAGEMGASFVVVAEEVRRLAESSEQALHEIEELNRAIRQSVETIQSSVDQTGQSSLVVAGMSAELSAAAARQSQASAGLVEVTNRLAAIAETNAAGAEQITASIEQQASAFAQLSASSQELAGLAQKLQDVSQPLVGDEPAGAAQDGSQPSESEKPQ